MEGTKLKPVPPQVWSVPLCAMFGILSTLLVSSMMFLRQFQENAVSIGVSIVIFSAATLVVLGGLSFLLVMYYFPSTFGLPRRHGPEDAEGHAGTARDLFGTICGFAFAMGCASYFGVILYTQFDREHGTCTPMYIPWVGPGVMILFVLIQLFFYFDYHRHFHRLLWMLRSRDSMYLFPVRLILAACVGANLNLWFFATQTEGVEDYCHLEEEFFENQPPKFCKHAMPHCNPRVHFASYLLPFIAEYALFMLQEVAFWFHLTLQPEEAHEPHKRSYFFYAKPGLFLGVTALGVEVASFAVAYAKPHAETKQLIHVEIVDTLLHLSAILAFVVMMSIVIRKNYDSGKISWCVEDRDDQFRYDESVHLVVLLVTYAGFALYTSVDFCVNLSIKYEHVDYYLFAVVYADAFSLIDATLQVFLIWVLLHKRTEPLVSTNPIFRSVLVYMFFFNFAVWFADSYRNVHANRNPHAEASLDGHTWTIITHVAIPLTIYFRFHLAETYVHLLKARPVSLRTIFRPHKKALLEQQTVT